VSPGGGCGFGKRGGFCCHGGRCAGAERKPIFSPYEDPKPLKNKRSGPHVVKTHTRERWWIRQTRRLFLPWRAPYRLVGQIVIRYCSSGFLVSMYLGQVFVVTRKHNCGWQVMVPALRHHLALPAVVEQARAPHRYGLDCLIYGLDCLIYGLDCLMCVLYMALTVLYVALTVLYKAVTVLCVSNMWP